MTLFGWSKSASVCAMVIAAVAACSSDPLDPVPGRFDAVYVASSVGGEPLPYSINGVDVRYTIVADTLQFFSNGNVVRTAAVKFLEGVPPQETLRRLQSTMHYTVEGIRLVLVPVCGINELCIGAISGTIIPARVTLPDSFLGPRTGEAIFTRAER